MIRAVEWLLDLDGIQIGKDAPLLVKWNAPVPAWLLFGCALLAAIWIVIVYRKEKTTTSRRIVPALLRAALIVLVGAVICRPALVLERNRVEPSRVVVLLDTSQSMAARDRFEDKTLQESILRGAGVAEDRPISAFSRWELLRRALLRDEAAALRTILDRNELEIDTFASQVETLGHASRQDAIASLVTQLETLRPDGMATDIAGALARIVERAQGRRLAAIVLATDGQSTQPSSLADALSDVKGRQVPVFPIRLGSPVRPRDIEVGPVRADPRAFVNDLVAIEVQLTATGLTEPTALTVLLVDEATDDLLTQREVVLDGEHDSERIELRIKPRRSGRFRYRIHVPVLPNEVSAANNVAEVELTVVDDKLRLLYVEGYPRYEYRYLKNALLREATIDLSVLLLEADRDFVQEGTEPIRAFPETPEELSRFDVVIFGDVDPRGGWLTEAQMNMLLDFVGNSGGGFGLIAGERFAPQRFAGTPLQKLVPVRIDPTVVDALTGSGQSGFQIELTKEGLRSRLFTYAQTGSAGGNETRTDRAGRFNELGDLYWFARTEGAKPGASVLATHPTIRAVHGALPLMVLGRYGAGKIFFQATDDTWRWRRHTGELLHDTYWVQVARELMRSERLGAERKYVIRTDRRIYPYGQPVNVQLEVFDPQLLALNPGVIEVGVGELRDDPANANGDAPAVRLERTTHTSVEVHQVSKVAQVFEGSFVPPRAGSFQLSADSLAVNAGQRRPTATIRVHDPDLESRRPEANHDVLERIARATNGRVVELDRLTEELAKIKNRSVRIPDDVVEPLWDSKLTIILFTLLITAEWVTRKVFGLL